MSKEIILFYTTIGLREEAEKLATIAVEAKLAMCVNIIPSMLSIYRWCGSVESSQELGMLFKTTVEAGNALEQLIIKNHPYAVPALLKLKCKTPKNFYECVSAAVEIE